MLQDGTCQVCGRIYRLRDGLIVRHGHTPRVGAAACAGSGHLPFQDADDALRVALRSARSAALRAEQEAAALRALTDSPVGYLHVRHPHEHWIPGTYANDEASAKGTLRFTDAGGTARWVITPHAADEAALHSRHARAAALDAEAGAHRARVCAYARRLAGPRPTSRPEPRQRQAAKVRVATHDTLAGRVTVTERGRHHAARQEILLGSRPVLVDVHPDVGRAYLQALTEGGDNPYHPRRQNLRHAAFAQGLLDVAQAQVAS